MVPVMDGSAFGGWFRDDGTFLTQYDFSVPLEEGVTIYAKWESLRKVDFDLNYEDEPEWYISSEPGRESPRTGINEGGTILAPLDPERPEYTFMGWYKDKFCTEEWDFDNDTVTDDTVLYAKWSLPSAASGPESDGRLTLWPLISIIFLGLLFLLIFLDDDDEEIIGKVTYKDKGVAGVRIEYIEDDVKKSVTTDKDGDYSIGTEIGSYITITGVTKKGYEVSETALPMRIHVEEETTTVNFEMTERQPQNK
jgi:uncharacterized repeat protein (TIGR02543 family)